MPFYNNKKKEQKKDKKEEKEEKDQIYPIRNKGDGEQKDSLVALSISRSTSSSTESDVLIRITPPAEAKRCPVDVVCVVDISGSMSDRATTKDAAGRAESASMTMLNLVSHAVRTVASGLDAGDRLALVVFDDQGEERLPLRYMNDENKQTLYENAHQLVTRGGTNIWAGLETGMNTLQKAQATKGRRLGAVALLTDGQPTTSPNGGEALATRQYIEKNKLPGSVSTFGFGYNINTAMLSGIARSAGGSYTFIPDSTIVGTAFVNWTSNLLASAGNRGTLSLEPLNGAQLLKDQPVDGITTTWGLQYEIPTISYGQTRDIVVKMSAPESGSADTPFLRATFKYNDGWETREVETESSSNENPLEVRVQLARLWAIKAIASASKPEVEATIQLIEKDEQLSAEPRVAALLQDLKGQVLMGIAKPAFDVWGKHFLVSLEMTHAAQQCNNFKDPGIQHYGGALFRSIRDDLDEIFVKLPQPRTVKVQVDMNQYYNCHGGCFHGNAKVQLEDGSSKKCQDVEKGDRVVTANGSVTTVKCVLQTDMPGMAQLCRVGDLYVTPYHPVRIQGQWKFPIDLAETSVVPCQSVYTFLLENGSTVLVDGVEAVALAHNIRDDVVASHDFFGTNNVAEAMKRCVGWRHGRVKVTPEGFLRGADGKVTGLVESSRVEENKCGQMPFLSQICV